MTSGPFAVVRAFTNQYSHYLLLRSQGGDKKVGTGNTFSVKLKLVLVLVELNK